MAAELNEAFELLDLAVARAVDVAGEEPILPYAKLARSARSRIGFLGQSVVVALAGGTGSGKSSLLNALAGESVTATGHIRPTTQMPMAWIPANPEPGLVRLLDDLGIDYRVGHEKYRHLAVLDLPDTDSVVGTHRATVERLLPRVDAVVWVVDPEKYHDRVLHSDFLQPLQTYQEQFIFVLNQIDRLDGAQRQEVISDFRRSLSDDGIHSPVVVAIAADPPQGPPIDLDVLTDQLRRRFEQKQTVLSKLISDLRWAGEGLAEATGTCPGAELAFDQRWDEIRVEAINELTSAVIDEDVVSAAERQGEGSAIVGGGGPVVGLVGWLRRSRLGKALGLAPQTVDERQRPWRGRAGLGSATQMITGFGSDISFETGGAYGQRIRDITGPELIEDALVEGVEAARVIVGDFAETLRKPWWSMAAAIQWLVFAAMVAGAVWLWADPSTVEPGRWPWPLILMVGALAIGWTISRLVRRSGRKQGRQALAAYHRKLSDEIDVQISRRIGIPLRTIVRSRAELSGALTELGVATVQAETALLGASHT